jgi:hypothetical protein
LKLAKLPLFGASSSGEKQRQIFIKSAREIYNDGYKKFKNSVYRVASSVRLLSVSFLSFVLPSWKLNHMLDYHIPCRQ